MSRVSQFAYTTDVFGKKKRYPKDPNYTAVFLTVNDDYTFNYYVYATYTKVDFTKPELIKVSEEEYNKLIETFGSDIAVNLVNNEAEIYGVIQLARDVAAKNIQSIGEMLNLTTEG